MKTFKLEVIIEIDVPADLAQQAHRIAHHESYHMKLKLLQALGLLDDLHGTTLVRLNEK